MGRSLLALAAVLFVASSCFEDVPPPTQGFIEIGTGGVSGAEVFLDGVSQGAAEKLGPLEAGTYTVSVAKPYYDVAPADREVVVQPTKTARVDFAMTLVVVGAAHVTATDELLGGAVDGAAIFILDGSGTPQPTGVVTDASGSATLERLPPGPTRFLLRKDGFADTSPIAEDVQPFNTIDVAAQLGPPRAVLLEMFTYVVCPNCPPSSAEIRGMYRDNAGTLFAIEWHSVAGLPLYDARWHTHEIYYRGTNFNGWPAVVVQGGANDSPAVLVDSNASELAQYHARFEAQRGACSNDCPVAVKATGTIDALAATFTVRVKWRGGSLPGNLVLRTALIQQLVSAPGNDSPYDFVARDLHEEALTLTTPGQVVEFPESFIISGTWNADKMDLVSYVQSDDTHEILAVWGTRRVTLP
ncbi:MAG: PEGA domain-containing protein [bacterium]